MRISDWSSDVCSSDLRLAGIGVEEVERIRARATGDGVGASVVGDGVTVGRTDDRRRTLVGRHVDRRCSTVAAVVDATDSDVATRRSEEHTSELQSLMRISYAVFCLKKKKHKTAQTT